MRNHPCGAAGRFISAPPILSLLSISSPTAGATSGHNLFLVVHGHIPRGRLALLQLVFDHMVKRHGLGVYVYTRCVAVCASECLLGFVLSEPF
jgi:hypothetical protein